MTGFEPRSSGIGSDCSANCATTTAHWLFNFKLACLNYLSLTAYCLLHKLTFHVGIFGKQIDIRSTRNDFIGINIHLYSLRQNPHVLWSFLFIWTVFISVCQFNQWLRGRVTSRTRHASSFGGINLPNIIIVLKDCHLLSLLAFPEYNLSDIKSQI